MCMSPKGCHHLPTHSRNSKLHLDTATNHQGYEEPCDACMNAGWLPPFLSTQCIDIPRVPATTISTSECGQHASKEQRNDLFPIVCSNTLQGAHAVQVMSCAHLKFKPRTHALSPQPCPIALYPCPATVPQPWPVHAHLRHQCPTTLPIRTHAPHPCPNSIPRTHITHALHSCSTSLPEVRHLCPHPCPHIPCSAQRLCQMGIMGVGDRPAVGVESMGVSHEFRACTFCV